MRNRLWCALFGHAWEVGPDDWPSDVSAARTCSCGASRPAIKWPRGVDKHQTIWSPRGPIPGMHPPPPPTRIVTDGVHPDYQDAYNRKHKLGPYDPVHLAQVLAYKYFCAAMQQK